MKKILLSVLILAVFSSAQAVEDGGIESPFSFGFGARDISLGGANMTNVAPSTAIYWNSSQLGLAEQFEIVGYHSRLYESDVAYQYFGMAYPTVDYGTFGIGISRLGVSGIDKRDASNFDIGEFDDTRLGIYLAYGKQYHNYDIGMMFNIEQHSIDIYKSTSSPGLNLSVSREFLLKNSVFNNFKIAFRYANLLKPSMKLAEKSITYPGKLQVGISSDMLLSKDWNTLISLYTKVSKVEDLSTKIAMGIELSFYDMLNIRLGNRDRKFSIGTGISYKMINFDYALVNRDMGIIHMFSLNSAFGVTVSEKRNLRRQKDEHKFNQLMSERLREKNNKIISDFTKSGYNHLNNNELSDAVSDFERVLFFTKSNNLDTTEVTNIILKTNDEIQTLEKENSYSRLIDSAQYKFDNTLFLEAKYFADRALTLMPNSKEAQLLLDSCNANISIQLQGKELLSEKLWVADSLISYGNITHAQRVLTELEYIAPNDKRVNRLKLKTQFEQYRNRAEKAAGNNEFTLAKELLDSASVLFPGHQWCSEFEKVLRDVIQKPTDTVKSQNVSEPIVVLSENIKKEASNLYKIAQVDYKKGDLQSAVSKWEKVEKIAPGYKSVRKYLVNAYKYFGVELYGNNKLYEAVKVWRKAETLNPSNKEILNYIKRTLNEIKKVKELTTYGNK